MEQRINNPLDYQENLSSVQTVEIKDQQGGLPCSGYAAISTDVQPISCDMSIEPPQRIDHLEETIAEWDIGIGILSS